MSDNSIYLQIFRGFCSVIAIALTSWCFYEYELDNDISDISLRRFHETPDDIHPSITLCRKDPFQYYKKFTNPNGKIKRNNNIILRYISFIRGDDSIKRLNSSIQEQLLNMSYDSLTVRLEDVVKEFSISYPVNLDDTYKTFFNARDNTLIMNKNDSERPKDTEWENFTTFDHITTYISARHGNCKCFTFDIPVIKAVDIRTIHIQFQDSSADIELGLYYIMLTYPNQTLQVSRGNQIHLDQYIKNTKPNCYKFEVFVGTMEVFRRRNKPKQRCNEDWRHHDQKQLYYIANKVGCIPKHWNTPSHLSNCSSVEDHNKINQLLFRKDSYIPPCRSIEGLSKITKGTDLEWRCHKKYLEMQFHLDEERFYKEISVVRAYTFQSLIGNAGNCFNEVISIVLGFCFDTIKCQIS